MTNPSTITELARSLRVSPTLEINELVQKRLENGQKVVHLGFGEATFPVHQAVLAAHREASESTSYLPVAGLTKLRESIAKFQSRRLGSLITPDQVVVAPGSKPLLFALFDVLDGDVLLPRPSWVSYEPQVIHAGKKTFWVETNEHDRHTITESTLTASFKQAVSSGGNPRVMLINSPSNPTGQVYAERVLDTIREFCHEHSITLISDEIYSDIVFDKEGQTSAFAGHQFNEGLHVLTGGLSKTYSAGGWRVGYAIFPTNTFGNELQKAIMAYASECWSAASAPAQEAAAIAFDTSAEMDCYRQQVTDLHKRCTLKLYRALADSGLAVAEPKGSFYVYPSFHPYTKQLQDLGIKTSLQLSRWLIDEFGVATLPGSAFGEDDAGVPGGRYRLRMATSYLYFRGEEDRYKRGYDILASSSSEEVELDLPLLDEAIEAIQKATLALKALP